MTSGLATRSPLTAESRRARAGARAGGGPPPPAPADVGHLRPQNGAGALQAGFALALSAGGIALSLSRATLPWLAGQALLSIAMVQWFCLLHEAGHNTLFASRPANLVFGRIASFFAGIPFTSWKQVHKLHHKWTGWQDLDPTTASLAPRLPGQERSRAEMIIGNVAWKLSIGYYAAHYRIAYLRFDKVKKAAADAAGRRAIVVDTLLLLALYAGLAIALGPLRFARLFGLAVVLSLVWLEPLILSQHTHIPMKLGRDAPPGTVKAIDPVDQPVYTRSIRVPAWMATGILFGFDAHELHHVYPWVPGHALRKIAYPTPNEMEFFAWLRRVKAMRAEDFLLKNRDATGEDV